MNILVSACLLGINCRYDGGAMLCEKLHELAQTHRLIPVCPEILGGLPTPRPPAELQKGQVMTCNGTDVTQNFVKGAHEALKLAQFFDCTAAILKERSPSCGFGRIYDGSFSGAQTNGNGVAAQLLFDNGLQIVGESGLDAFAQALSKAE